MEPSRGEIPVSEGQEVEINITSLDRGGEGVGRVSEYLVFVKGALPGERVKAKVGSVGRRYARAVCTGVLEASPDRVKVPCPHFAYCGGCDYQHLDYAKQLITKETHLREMLQEKLGRDEIPMQPVTAPDAPWQQRSKLTLHLHKKSGRMRIGLFQPRTRKVFGMEQCPVQRDVAVEALRRTTRGLKASGLSVWKPGGSGDIKAVILRSSASSDRAHIVLVTSKAQLPGIASLHAELEGLDNVGLSLHVHKGSDTQDLNGQDYHLSGPERLEEEIDGVRYLFSPTAFFQTSPWGAARLTQIVRELCHAPPDSRVVDLYCGGGLLSLAVAKQVKEVIGIEIDPSAVADAKATAKLNGVENVSFRHGAAELLERDFKFIHKPHTVILDPPRSGCDSVVLPAIASEFKPKEIIYVSCNPESLADDILVLEEKGYKLRTLVPLDMFPHTHHLEVVAALDAQD